jgi:predicted ribosomally synthesized peptide with SipW-like signal peptide
MRKPQIVRHVKSTRVRAGLSLGVVGVLAASGTFAYWTDSVTVSGTSFTTGTLALQVDNAHSVNNASGTLTMTGMVPGNTSAQILTVKNNGTVPLKWTLAANLTGTNATDFGTAGALSVTVKTGANIGGSGNSATCSGGTVVGSATTLTTSSSSVVATPQPSTPGSGLGAGGTVPLCFQVTFDSNAATSLQNKTTLATFTFSATSDLS